MKYSIIHNFARFQITQLYLQCPIQNKLPGRWWKFLSSSLLWQLSCSGKCSYHCFNCNTSFFPPPKGVTFWGKYSAAF